MGDGTSDVLYEDDSILFMSIHRWDRGRFYGAKNASTDKVGEGKGEGYNVLFPINREPKEEPISDKDYIYACETVFFPIIRKFAPDLIVISAGFDSAHGDILGQFDVTPLGYSWMTQGLRKIQPKVCVTLEGGYSLEALARSSEAVIRTLMI